MDTYALLARLIARAEAGHFKEFIPLEADVTHELNVLGLYTHITLPHHVYVDWSFPVSPLGHHLHRIATRRRQERARFIYLGGDEVPHEQVAEVGGLANGLDTAGHCPKAK